MAAPLLLAALALLAPGAVEPPATAAPDHPCQGFVDVLCTDHYGTCDNRVPPECQQTPYRSCTVWVTYLDIALPEDDGPLLCQDNPYHGS